MAPVITSGPPTVHDGGHDLSLPAQDLSPKSPARGDRPTRQLAGVATGVQLNRIFIISQAQIGPILGI